MRVLQALFFAYCGAVLAGLLIAVVTLGFDLSAHMAVSAATVTGMVFGLCGFSLPWWRPLFAAHARRSNN